MISLFVALVPLAISIAIFFAAHYSFQRYLYAPDGSLDKEAHFFRCTYRMKIAMRFLKVSAVAAVFSAFFLPFSL